MPTQYRSGAHNYRDRFAVTQFRLIATNNIAPADSELKAGQCALWFDSTAGASKLNYKLKDAAGTVFSGQAKETATNYTLAGPAAGAVLVASAPFTVGLPPGSKVTGTVTVTPNDSGGGGTFTPATVPLTTASTSATFTYTPATVGTKTIRSTNNGGLTDPPNLSYVAS